MASYPKTLSGDAIQQGDETGEINMKAMTDKATGGPSSSVSGPTTSPCYYPKGTKVSTDASRLNPQKVAATTNYVGVSK
jgi:hypothetical protein